MQEATQQQIEQAKRETEDHILAVTHKANVLVKAIHARVNTAVDINTGYNMCEVSGRLLDRTRTHDASKLKEPELSNFARITPLLKGSTYGSPAYAANLEQLGPALQHHYEKNSHHPEHYETGILGMCMVDVMEMFCDWQAAVLSQEGGDIYKSIEINQERFNMSDQLTDMLRNSLKHYGQRRGAPMGPTVEPTNMCLVDFCAAFSRELGHAQVHNFEYSPKGAQERLEGMVGAGYAEDLVAIMHNTLVHFDEVSEEKL